MFGLTASRFLFDKTTAEKHSNTEARDKVAGIQGFIGTALVFAIYPVFNSGLVSYSIYSNIILSNKIDTFGRADAYAVIIAYGFRSYFNTLFAGMYGG